MRQPVRPFITEFKSRSSKSSAARPPSIEGADEVAQTPRFLDTSVFSARQKNSMDDYEAAMRAADAVFGKSISSAPFYEKAPPPDAPVGQVLPSLVEEDDPLTVRLKNADEKPRRGRPPGKSKSSSHAPRNEPLVQPEPLVQTQPIVHTQPIVQPEPIVQPQPIVQTQTIVQPERKAAQAAAERPSPIMAPEQAIDSAARRERSSIQQRWVLKTERKAGEKWKRRLR